jgi:hypothetical protein
MAKAPDWIMAADCGLPQRASRPGLHYDGCMFDAGEEPWPSQQSAGKPMPRRCVR